MYICMNTYINIKYTYMCIFVYIYTYVYSIHKYVYLCDLMCVWIYTRQESNAYIHMWTYRAKKTWRCMYIYTCMYLHIYMYVSTKTHIDLFVYSHPVHPNKYWFLISEFSLSTSHTGNERLPHAREMAAHCLYICVVGLFVEIIGLFRMICRALCHQNNDVEGSFRS